MEYIIIFVISYAIGNINPAILVGKYRRGIDIRSVNSKNAGTSNVTMTVGWRWGMFVLFLDMLKGFLPALIVRLIYPEADALWVTAVFGAIIGHIYPVLYKFKGGKGSATFGGAMFALNPFLALALLFIYISVLYITDYIALSTLAAIIITPIALYFLDFSAVSIILISIFSFISFFKHLENFKRILKGDEVGIRKFNKNKEKIRVTKEAVILEKEKD